MARILAERAAALSLLFAILGFIVSGGEAVECYTQDFCTGRTVDVSSGRECCLGVGSSFSAVAGSGQCFQCGDVTIGFGLPSLTVVESDGQFTMCVLKSGNTTSTVSVNITVTDITAIGGLDYRPATIPETVTIGPTEERVCFTGIIIDDVLGLEDDEDFRLTLVDPIPGSVAIGQETTTITIQDDDVVTVRFLQSTYSVLRSDEFVTVCLTKDLATATTVTVRISTKYGTATDGLDYIGGSFYVTLSSSAAAVACQNITILGISLQETIFFVRLDRAPEGVIIGEPSTANITIQLGPDDDRNNCMNDTVFGDPLYIVPFTFGGNTQFQLCYEVHGKPYEYFNLISSRCVLVNARYQAIGSNRNTIDQIAIKAAYELRETGRPVERGCKYITVDLKGCNPTPKRLMSPESIGISVEKLEKPAPPRVTVKVPNCGDEKNLEMHIICEKDMLRFDVLRGVTGGHTETHGLLGQFWDMPPTSFFPDPPALDCKPDEAFTIEFNNRGRRGDIQGLVGQRKFTGCWHPIKWDGSQGECLYVGDQQASCNGGGKASCAGDPVIEGNYEDYIVSQFGDLDRYPRFDSALCPQHP